MLSAYIVAGIGLLGAYLAYRNGSGPKDIIELLLLDFTLISIIIYSYLTAKIASRIDGAILYGINPDPHPIEELDTDFYLHNRSNIVIHAYVCMSLKTYGQNVPIKHKAYIGKKVWTIPSGKIYTGHFSMAELLEDQGKNVEEMKAKRTEGSSVEQLVLDIDVRYNSAFGEHQAGYQSWHFDFERMRWVADLTQKEED